MENDSIDHIRTNGIYYTPPALAEFLVKPLIRHADIAILDPACGEGSLLRAAKKRCVEVSGDTSERPSLVGCDKISIGKLDGLGDCRVFNCDFLKFSNDQTFDLILMNPPYVRHHLINNEDRNEYQKETSKICQFRKLADLWVYFLVKSVCHLKKGGSIGAILPWSFLQSDYARDIRLWLLRKFARIRVLALSSEYFERAEERVILVWVRGYGEETKSVEIAFGGRVDERVRYHKIDKAQWGAAKVIFSAKNDVASILQRYIDKFCFSRFGRYATVRIGIVTGADRFFILNQDIAIKRGFRKKQNLIPIISTSKELTGLCLDGNEPKKVLIRFPKECSGKFSHYITEGEERDYHLRAHSVRRNPWYAVDVGTVPDAFFPYRVSRTPYLVFNDKKIQCTNSVHRVYFENITENARRWIQVSLLSAAGQLSLEAYSKTYGSGVLKIEPSSLTNAIVHKGSKKIQAQIYNAISQAISKKDKELAVRLATKFINDTLCIPEDLSSQTISCLDELQRRRLSRS